MRERPEPEGSEFASLFAPQYALFVETDLLQEPVG